MKDEKAGKNFRVSESSRSVLCHAKLLQSCPPLCNPMDCSLPASSVHGILQANVLQWVAIPSPGDFPNPGIKLMSLTSPTLAGGFLTTRATWEATCSSACRYSSHYDIMYYDLWQIFTEHLLCVLHHAKCLYTTCFNTIQSLGQQDPLEKEMATHSSTLAWKIPLTEEHGRLQSMGLQRVRHDWATSLSLHFLSNLWLIFFFSKCLMKNRN